MTATTAIPPSVFRAEERPNARLRLLCFAHAGGSATAFATWHRSLPEEIEVCAVQLPGRDSRHREAPNVDMHTLLERLAGEFACLHDRPLALFGHSLGGLMAFEYARRLPRTGQTAPTRLMVSGCRVPQYPRAGGLSELPPAAFLAEMTRRYDGIPKVILDDPDMLDYFLPILRADIRLLESYRYSAAEPLCCPITALGGDADPRVPTPELELWAEHTTGAFCKQVLPGGHFYVTTARDALLTTVARVLLT